jgi:predicted DNA-binding protein (MmcQ/YjbR family)
MTDAELRAYLLAKPQAGEEHPFGPGVSVYKVLGKVFALVPDGGPLSMTVKCEPNLALLLRETYPAVRPGYHTDKRHWNTVAIDGSIPDAELREMVDHSYDRVVHSLPKYMQRRLRSG